MQVDPSNRLVADSLEADWNEKLRALDEAQQEYERQRQADRAVLDEKKRERILALATDFPKLWVSPGTPDRERKRMLRLLIEDITLIKGKEITAHIRFRGGATKTIMLPLPLPAFLIRKADPHIIAEIDHLLDQHTDEEIANILQSRGFRTVDGTSIRRQTVCRLRTDYSLKSRYERLREAGMLTREEVAQALDVVPSTVNLWRRKGWLRAVPYNDKNNCLYEPLVQNAPVKYKWKNRKKPVTNHPKEVQCEA